MTNSNDQLIQRFYAAFKAHVKGGGRLVYATCSLLREENEAIADAFAAAHPQFDEVSCADLLASQRIDLEGERLRLWPHRHGTDGFFAAAFVRRAG